MKATAVHQQNDWYLVQLPGFSDTNKKQIDVDINLTTEELHSMDYKSLRGSAILERFYEKREREIDQEIIDESLLDAFNKKFGISNFTNISDVINKLK